MFIVVDFLGFLFVVECFFGILFEELIGKFLLEEVGVWIVGKIFYFIVVYVIYLKLKFC